MDFVKKHYEKIILSLVLLGLVGALVFLPFIISADKQQVEVMITSLINPPVKPLPDLDLSRNDAAIQRLHSDFDLDLETTNKLFNPVEWQKTPDGNLIPIRNSDAIGVGAVVVTKISPLYLIVSLQSVMTNELGARYAIGIERQAAPTRAQQHRVERYVSVDDRKKDLFTLEDVKGAPESPDEIDLKLADTGEAVVITRDKPFQRIDGYTADFRYDPEKRTFLNRRVGSVISFGGDDYTIVDIKPDEVILSAQSNQKRTTKPYTP
jgi:hypothetical protein